MYRLLNVSYLTEEGIFELDSWSFNDPLELDEEGGMMGYVCGLGLNCGSDDVGLESVSSGLEEMRERLDEDWEKEGFDDIVQELNEKLEQLGLDSNQLKGTGWCVEYDDNFCMVLEGDMDKLRERIKEIWSNLD